MRQKLTAVVKTTVAVDDYELKKALEKMAVTVESTKVEKANDDSTA
jgi:hypothetical protein